MFPLATIFNELDASMYFVNACLSRCGNGIDIGRFKINIRNKNLRGLLHKKVTPRKPAKRIRIDLRSVN